MQYFEAELKINFAENHLRWHNYLANEIIELPKALISLCPNYP
jgi:hypothetical protein